jgi:PIN domain nuclease of toxin-antitoxin system
MYLVDSHVFLWCLFEPARLSKPAHDLFINPIEDVFVSTITFWELSLKYGIGKLDLEEVTPDVFPDAAIDAGFSIMPMESFTAASFHKLPRELHNDPFDRMLAWQAICKEYTLVSCDTALKCYEKYGLGLLW